LDEKTILQEAREDKCWNHLRQSIMKRIPKAIRSVLYATVFLLVSGFVILYFIKDSAVALKDILFWVGVVPIAFFSIGTFGNFFGKKNSSYQLSRPVSDQSAKQRPDQDARDQQSKTRFGLTWISAGLLVWLISYFL
jgi:hypothetical protein